MTKKDKLLKDALVLPIQEKSELIEQLIKSLDKPDPEIDAFDEGLLRSVSVQEAVSTFKN
jgi:hypothetical protein